MLERRVGVAIGIVTLMVTLVAINAVSVYAWEPQRQVEMVVPASPGGGYDLTLRSLADVLQKEGLVSVSTPIVYRPGGGTILGLAYVAGQNDDPHYLAVTSTSAFNGVLSGTTDISPLSLTPIVRLMSEYQAIVVPANSPYDTLDELMGALRRDPGAVAVGIGASYGGDDQISFALVAKEAGVDISQIRFTLFQSGGDLNTALLSGTVGVVSGSASEMIPYKKSGDVRFLGVSSPRRMGGVLADVPTYQEAGYDVVFNHWRGIVAAPNISDEARRYWEEVIVQAVNTNTWKEIEKRYQWAPTEDVLLKSDEFDAFVEQQLRVYGELWDDLGLR